MIILLQYETPPIFREESSSADEKEFVSPLLKGNSVTKVNEVWIDIAPRNDGDEKKANVKETKPPEKRTYSRTAQKSKQQSTRPKYKEVIHPLKKQFSMGDQVAEESYLQSGSRS